MDSKHYPFYRQILESLNQKIAENTLFCSLGDLPARVYITAVIRIRDYCLTLFTCNFQGYAGYGVQLTVISGKTLSRE